MSTFWPQKLTEWAQTTAPIVTLGAVLVALRASGQNSRWRHEDFEAERRATAARVGCVVKTNTPWPHEGGWVAKVESIEILNDSGEALRDVRVKIFANSSSDAPLTLFLPQQSIGHWLDKRELYFDHLSPGAHTMRVDSEQFPGAPPRSTEQGQLFESPSTHVVMSWTDCTLYHWMSTNNELPTNLDPATQKPVQPKSLVHKLKQGWRNFENSGRWSAPK